MVKGAVHSTDSKVILELRLFDVISGRQVLAKLYTGKASAARAMANRFTNDALEQITGVPGVFGSEIIFCSGSPLRKQIMKATFGGDQVVTISEGQGINTQPTIGPDGSVAWVRRNGQKWELLLNGQVVSSGARHLAPAFKPDGTLVAAMSDSQKTTIYDFSVKPPKFLVGLGGISVSPTFSPDGSQMAFVSVQGGVPGIYILPASGEGEAKRLPINGQATDPAWSPTGEYIAFVSRGTDICIIRPDGSGYRQLTGGQGANYRPSFSPDGRMIVFSSDRNGRPRLFVMAANGDNQRPLLPNAPQPQEQPYWSPVGPKPVKTSSKETDISPAKD